MIILIHSLWWQALQNKRTRLRRKISEPFGPGIQYQMSLSNINKNNLRCCSQSSNKINNALFVSWIKDIWIYIPVTSQARYWTPRNYTFIIIHHLSFQHSYIFRVSDHTRESRHYQHVSRLRLFLPTRRNRKSLLCTCTLDKRLSRNNLQY